MELDRTKWVEIETDPRSRKVDPEGRRVEGKVHAGRARVDDDIFDYWFGSGGVREAHQVLKNGRVAAVISWFDHRVQWLSSPAMRAGVYGAVGPAEFFMQFSRRGWRRRNRSAAILLADGVYWLAWDGRALLMTDSESDRQVAACITGSWAHPN